MRSLGASKFSRLAVTLEEASNRIGVSKSAISKWRSGEAKPGRNMRQAISREWPEIAEGDWSQGEETRQAPAAGPALSSMTAIGEANLVAANDLLRMADDAQREVDGDPDVSSRLRNMQLIAKLRGDLGRITGDTRELTDEKLVRMPAVTRLLERVAACLCDECLAKVGKVSSE